MKQFVVTGAPHIRSDAATSRIMLDVIIALVPAAAAGTLIFGFRALAVMLLAVLSCVVFEWVYRLIMKKPSTIGDLSAVVTGLLLSMCLPATVPYYMVVAGSFFAVVVVKQLFGGLGKNIFNPALAGRAFLFCWPAFMVRYAAAGVQPGLFADMGDIASSATPLHHMVMPSLPPDSLLNMFLGKIGGSIGEVSAAALIVGLIYLLVRRVITIRIPASFIGTVFVLTLIFHRSDASAIQWALYSVLGGGVMLGAVFMATDYATSPVTPIGQIVYGIGCGAITVLIRYFGLYPEGVSYAILIMNAISPIIDKLCAPRVFGTAKGGAAK